MRFNGIVFTNMEDFIDFLNNTTEDMEEHFCLGESGESEEANKAEEFDEVYSKRELISIADFEHAVEKAGLLTIVKNPEIGDATISAMANMAFYMGVALFGEEYLDTRTEKEEN